MKASHTHTVGVSPIQNIFSGLQNKKISSGTRSAFLFSLWPLASHLPGTARVRAEAAVGEGDLDFFVVHFEGKLCQLHFSKLSQISPKFVV